MRDPQYDIFMGIPFNNHIIKNPAVYYGPDVEIGLAYEAPLYFKSSIQLLSMK
jgi:hypothetical protein